MLTNIARGDDYDQPHAAAQAPMTIPIVDDDTTARLTIAALIANDAAARMRRQYQTPMHEGS